MLAEPAVTYIYLDISVYWCPEIRSNCRFCSLNEWGFPFSTEAG